MRAPLNGGLASRMLASDNPRMTPPVFAPRIPRGLGEWSWPAYVTQTMESWPGKHCAWKGKA
jgi:hypothetical protein